MARSGRRCLQASGSGRRRRRAGGIDGDGAAEIAATEAAHSLRWTLLCRVFWSQRKKMDHERALVDPPMEVQEVQEILPEEKGILHSAEFLLILGSVGSMLYIY